MFFFFFTYQLLIQIVARNDIVWYKTSSDLWTNTFIYLYFSFLSNSRNVFMFAVHFYTDIRRQGAAERKHFHFSTVSLDSFFLYFLLSISGPTCCRLTAFGLLSLFSFKEEEKNHKDATMWYVSNKIRANWQKYCQYYYKFVFFCGQTFSRKLVKDERFQKQSVNCEVFLHPLLYLTWGNVWIFHSFWRRATPWPFPQSIAELDRGTQHITWSKCLKCQRRNCVAVL